MTDPVRFVALLFPEVTELDLTGPVQFFSRLPNATVELAWKTLDPVRTDAKFSIVPTTTLSAAPQADVLLIPGGFGVFDLMNDPEVIAWVQQQAASARYVTSVCTGSFVLAAAGLLQGKRATTHWSTHPLLDELGVIRVNERIVRDGNIITGGGITSGLDFALALAAEVYDDDTARRLQLAMEYDPHPPFDAGSPSRPGADQQQVSDSIERIRSTYAAVVRETATRLGAADDGAAL
ncbi:DJ-1/PfpI family protein [Microbacterium sp. RD1]|uniref:DJ-1/PfpI family protein n=1 Tax=Microbacterium sp. RD1 TaxID=3457313 RepID=UPI003FA54E8E